MWTARRPRNKHHRDYASQRACLVCRQKPADARHLRSVQPRAMGRKASDEFTALCRIHHRALHRPPDEMAWVERIQYQSSQRGSEWCGGNVILKPKTAKNHRGSTVRGRVAIPYELPVNASGC